MNNYMQYMLQEHGPDDLRSLSEKDEYAARQNHKVVSSYPLTDEMLNFYLTDMNLSAFDFINIVNRKGRSELAELLYSRHFENAAERREWIEKLKPGIEKSPEFFLKCIKICLANHEYSEQRLHKLQDQDYIEYEAIVKQNRELFSELVTLGIANNLFQNLNPKELFTSNTRYQEELVTRGVFKVEFSFKDMLDYFRAAGKNNKFVATHLTSIIEYFNTNPDMIDRLAREELLSRFSQEYFDIYNPARSEQEKAFALSMVRHPEVVNSLSAYTSDSEKPLERFIRNYSEFVLPCIQAFNHTQKERFFKAAEIKDAFPGNPNSDFSMLKWFSVMIGNEGQQSPRLSDLNLLPSIAAEMLRHTFEYLEYAPRYGEKIYPNAEKMQEAFASKMLTCCIARFPTLDWSDLVAERSQHFGAHLNLNYKSFDIDLDYMKKTLEIIPQVNRRFAEKKTVATLQTQIYALLTKENSHNLQKGLEAIATMLKVLPAHLSNEIMLCLSADTENPLWASKVVDYEYQPRQDRRQAKYHEDYPFAFALLNMSKGQALEWFIRPENLEHFAALRYKGKSIINLYSNAQWVNGTIKEQLVNNPQAFKVIVMENRAVQKYYAGDEAVEKAILYNRLDKKLKDTPTPTPRKAKI